jgi:Flp pilus assembly pilin Flp
MKKLIQFFKEEDGLELTEYALMAFLIAVGIAVVIGALGDRIYAILDGLVVELGGTSSGTAG